VGFRRFVALPVLAGLAGVTGVVALAATTFADPPTETPAVGGKLLDPETLQVVLAPPASANTTPPPTSTPPTTTVPPAAGQFAVTPPTPPSTPASDPGAASTATPAQPPDLLTSLLGALGLPTAPCTGPGCEQTDVGCSGGSPFCVQLVR
jgi:hypothetical protein